MPILLVSYKIHEITNVKHFNEINLGFINIPTNERKKIYNTVTAKKNKTKTTELLVPDLR